MATARDRRPDHDQTPGSGTMNPILKKLYSPLEVPWVYRLAGNLLAPGWRRLSQPLLQRTFDPSVERVLDVGCGPVLNSPEPEGLLVGVDVNESYIRQYTGGFLDKDPKMVLAPPPSRRRLGFVVSADRLPFDDGSFDEARTWAVFHHLTDEEVSRALREMRRCVRRGGRLLVLDNVWPLRAWARPLAWITLRLDRGRHMRGQERLSELCREACPGTWEWERHTYTYTGLEFLCLKQVKE